MYYRRITTFLLLLRLSFIVCFCEEYNENKLLVLSTNSSYAYESFTYNGTISECECTNKTCIRKCCADNYVYANKTCVYSYKKTRFSIFNNKQITTVDDANIKIISGNIKCESKYILLPNEERDDELFLQKDGRVWVPVDDYTLDLDSYCIDDTNDGIIAYACFPKTISIGTINIAGMLISVPFLFATFVIYGLLPNLNIHGKSLMCYVLTLLLAYLLLSVINSLPMEGMTCITIFSVYLYFFTSSFFWMNVMSIDIWRTFSGKRSTLGNAKEIARKQYLMYNIYAWGVPLILVIIVGCLNHYSDTQAWYSPGISVNVCWFRRGIPELVYLYAPLASIILINLLLFAVTAIRIRKLQKDTEMLRSEQCQKHSEEQKRFKLYIKLSLAMGINWITEIMAWAIDWQFGSLPASIWYFTDFCNAIYGVFIFFIFAFKKKVWITLRQKYPCGSNNISNEHSQVTTT